MKTINVIFILSIACVLGYILLTVGISKSEQYECHKLQSQAQAGYAGHFYITQWQKDMCDHYSIEINSPVQK